MLGELCNELKIKKLVHVSALGVKEGHRFTIHAVQSFKEKKIFEDTFKLSVLFYDLQWSFGPEDKFFNTFASLAQFSPALPLIGGGKRQFLNLFMSVMLPLLLLSHWSLTIQNQAFMN